MYVKCHNRIKQGCPITELYLCMQYMPYAIQNILNIIRYIFFSPESCWIFCQSGIILLYRTSRCHCTCGVYGVCDTTELRETAMTTNPLLFVGEFNHVPVIISGATALSNAWVFFIYADFWVLHSAYFDQITRSVYSQIYMLNLEWVLFLSYWKIQLVDEWTRKVGFD